MPHHMVDEAVAAEAVDCKRLPCTALHRAACVLSRKLRFKLTQS